MSLVDGEMDTLKQAVLYGALANNECHAKPFEGLPYVRA
ncbi:hypothetical protein Krac_4628 [Ktedonobacter racemifer DSM 44963]|uniref:Uncharacterized protein n=1 Tax=Ktedonobacter racemifer DSM 44963 TaxID=485913 RepID=D6TT85_KTERA|nr:hypothetical protein Krac_4628 [Ktedonobacter racemifer DSM 44963]